MTEGARSAPEAAAIGAQLRAAIGTATVFTRAARGVARDALAGGLAFYPLVGLAMGAVAAAGAAGVGGALARLAGAAGVAVLALLAGPRDPYALAVAAGALLGPGDRTQVLARLRGRPGAPGTAVAAAAVAARVWAATVLPTPARTTAFLFAPLLGAWAIVVQCYGGTSTRARGPAAALVGRARFREFGWASLVALGTVLLAADAVGLVLAVVAALVTVGVRLWAHRRAGALTGRLLAATREAVATVVFVLLGALAR